MTVADIKQAVRQLDETQLAEFRDWFREHDNDAWDRQMEEDAASGKLDAFADQALAHHRAGRTRPVPSERDVDEADVA